jgi:hypothetical protein
LRDLVGDRLEHVLVEHLVPVREIAEQERRVDERRCLGEGRHVGGRNDRVVDRLALRHVLEILLLQAELAVLVEHEIDRLAARVFFQQLIEAHHRLGEGMLVVELRGAVQRQALAQCGQRERRHRGEQKPPHDFLSSLIVIRQSVRGSEGSVSVAE